MYPTAQSAQIQNYTELRGIKELYWYFCYCTDEYISYSNILHKEICRRGRGTSDYYLSAPDYREPPAKKRPPPPPAPPHTHPLAHVFVPRGPHGVAQCGKRETCAPVCAKCQGPGCQVGRSCKYVSVSLMKTTLTLNRIEKERGRAHSATVSLDAHKGSGAWPWSHRTTRTPA